MGLRITTGALLLVLLLSLNSAQYISLGSPQQYRYKEKVAIEAQPLTSIHSSLRIRNEHLPLCQSPAETMPHTAVPLNIGQLLSGYTVRPSPYQFFTLVDEPCKVLCGPLALSADESAALVQAMKLQYISHWTIDGLPVAVESAPLPPFAGGVPLAGRWDPDGSYRLFNHIHFYIEHQSSPDSDAIVIVGATAELKSVEQSVFRGMKTCSPSMFSAPAMFPLGNVTWTYGVSWIDANDEESDMSLSTRWEPYLSMFYRYPDEIHIFSIINSTIIVIFLTVMLVMIRQRALKYFQGTDLTTPLVGEGTPTPGSTRTWCCTRVPEEVSWRLIAQLQGDVFRPPEYPFVFSLAVGAGCQAFCATLITLVVAATGLISAVNNGAFLSCVVYSFTASGFVSGYQAAQTYKLLMSGVATASAWKWITVSLGVCYPLCIISYLLLLNGLVWARAPALLPASSAAVATVVHVGILLVIHIVLVTIGAKAGLQRAVTAFPTETNATPREIPSFTQWSQLHRRLLRPWVQALIGGVLGFGCVFIEAFFIITTVWMNQYYNTFGFLIIVFTLFILTSGQIAIVLIFFQLQGEDYRWWWRSLYVPGASALYVFAYAVLYERARLQLVSALDIVYYLGHMLLVSGFLFLTASAIGYTATLWFLRRLYGFLKAQ